MGRELDKRNFSANVNNGTRFNELINRAKSVSESLPGNQQIHIHQFDAITGNPAVVALEAGNPELGNYINRALEFVQTISGPLGLEATQPVEFSPDPHEMQTSSGAVNVYLRQLYKGVPIFQAAQTVRFEPEGSLTEAVGSSVTVFDDEPVEPTLTSEEAVLVAAKHIAVPEPDEMEKVDEYGQPLGSDPVDVSDFVPKQIVKLAQQADQTTYFQSGPFGDKIRARLLWFPLSEQKLILTWEVIISLAGPAEQFLTLVNAQSSEVVYCEQLTKSVLGSGSVYVQDGAGIRQKISFPRNWADYELPIPADFPPLPDEWISTQMTEGNCVIARLGDNGSPVEAQLIDDVITFNPSDTSTEQQVLNIFYFNCFMHDFFYLLGFREKDGNFQSTNFNRGGLGGDRVDARAHPVPVYGTANMKTSVDGRNPIMNMGLVARTNRHTAFDASVVFHEFTHGVTNRLVGGPLYEHSLSTLQSSGMGEGWGDYIACTILKTNVVGAWVIDKPGGIRLFPYDINFPDHFGNLGQGRYREVHNIGEIWCATLMEMNRQIGSQLGLQLVIDALKLSPANPSFLDMRDAILMALQNKLQAKQLGQTDHQTALRGIWQTFARYGMGPSASSNGALLTGIVADFNIPPDL